MDTRQELILKFMLALSANSSITEAIHSPNDILRAACALTDEYYKIVA
jgi:hypothetical protein